MCDKRRQCSEKVNYAKVQGQSIPGHGSSKSEGSEARMCLACSDNEKKSVPGAGCSKQ